MKHFLKKMLMASLSLSALTTQAQDTYWSMAGNKVYNTKTNTLTSITGNAIPLDYSNPNPRAVFNPNGSVLFSSSMSSIDFAGAVSNITGEGARAIFPLTGVCNQYAVINAHGVTVPHGSALDISIVDVTGVTNDVTTTNIPSVASSANISIGDGQYYDAVAAPIQSNGDHFYYFISANNGPGQPGPFIEQYTIHSDGTRPTTVNSYGTTANYRQHDSYTNHYISSKAKISNDGAYIAYQDINGNLMSFNTSTKAYTIGPNLTTVYGLEGVNVAGTIRWYVSTATQFGYFTQGSATFNVLSTSAGIKSDVALGTTGIVFIARGTTTGGGAADLLSFDPTTTFSLSLKQSGCVYNNGTQYSFGNQTNGENTSEFSNVHTDFTVNTARGTLAAPKIVYTCQSITLQDLTSPAQTYMSMGITQVDASGNPVAGGFTYGYSFVRPFGGTINLKSLPVSGSTWLGTAGHEGYYKIVLFNSDACGRASNVTEYIKLETPAAPVVSTFSVAGFTQTTPGVYPQISLCDGATALTLASTIGGVFTNYDIIVTKLSGTGPFTYGTSASINVVSPTFTSIDMATNATLNTVLAGYNGYLSVQVRANGICGSFTKEEIFKIVRGTSLTSMNFTLNSISQTTSSPVDVWQCNGNLPLVVTPTVTGTVSDYTIIASTGTYAGGAFTPLTTLTNTGILPTAMPYDLALGFSGLSGYNGYLQVTITANGPCGTPQTTVHLFNIRAAAAIVDFLIIGPSDENSSPVCNTLGASNVGLQNKHQTLSFTSFTQPVTTPPCAEGWLGASTAGISKGSTVGTTATPTTSGYTIKVDEYDATGATFIKNVLLKNPTTIPASSYAFDSKTTPLHYFSNNYDLIKNNNIYKVTVSMTTVECGVTSQYAYFKIIDGGLAGSANTPEGWRIVKTEPQLVNVFPNPTTGEVHVSWQCKDAAAKDASILVVDVLGRVVIKKTLPQSEGMNDQVFNLSGFAPGTYHYMLNTANGETSGTIVKE